MLAGLACGSIPNQFDVFTHYFNTTDFLKKFTTI